ncbi:DMT family transporter [Sphingomonas sp. URHD0057]|uniref:DMT family transporter n=1 Tax=Sphingomonas sp. URHD0057 TaxID=1380389 RepID=UPI0004909D89|nr:DMT family transporter [Sphingomonas sp. URHD0057]
MNRVPQHPAQAFAVSLAAVGVLSVMDAVMKALVIAIGIYAISIWRSLVNLTVSAALYFPARRQWPTRKTLRIHIWRGVVVMVMALLFFWGIGRVPLAQAIALTFIAPLIALVLAALTLHERIGSRSILGSVVAFAGVLAIVFGQARTQLGPEVLLGSAAIIGSALCYAVNIVLMRHQALAAKPLEIGFFQSLTVAALWLAAVPLFGMPEWPHGHWLWIVIAGLMSITGGLLFSWAYARAQASYLAVTEYSAFLWASVLGWIYFHEKLSSYTLAGAALIIAGCLLAIRGKPAAPPEMDYT